MLLWKLTFWELDSLNCPCSLVINTDNFLLLFIFRVFIIYKNKTLFFGGVGGGERNCIPSYGITFQALLQVLGTIAVLWVLLEY